MLWVRLSWGRPVSYRVRTVHFLLTLPPAICDYLFLRDSLLSASLYLYIFYDHVDMLIERRPVSVIGCGHGLPLMKYKWYICKIAISTNK